MKCKLCGGVLYVLGVLGLIKHCRCRNCGMDFTKRARKRKGWA